MRLPVFSPVLLTTMRRAQMGRDELLARTQIQGSPKADAGCSVVANNGFISTPFQLVCYIMLLAARCFTAKESTDPYTCWLQVMEGLGP